MTHDPENENDAVPANRQDARPSAAEDSSAPRREVLEEGIEIIEAEMIVAEVIEEPMIINAIALPPSSFDPRDQSRGGPRPEVVVGSPFAQAGEHAETSFRENSIPVESYAARGAATAALALGVLSLVASWFSGLALFPCLFGMIMGFWGANSAFRRRAIAGLIMSLFAIALTMTMSIFRTVIADSYPVPAPTPNVTLVSEVFTSSNLCFSDARPLQPLTSSTSCITLTQPMST